MTITTYTDREIALQKRVAELEKELSDTDIALEECKMDWSGDVTQIKAEHKHEVETLRQQLAAETQLAQLNGEIAAELKADKLRLEAERDTLRQQLAEAMKDVERYRWLRDSDSEEARVMTYMEGLDEWLAYASAECVDIAIDAAMGGAA